MNKKLLAVLPLSALLLVGCSTSTSGSSKETSSSTGNVSSSSSSSSSSSPYSTKDIHWITPTGAPTLAFFDQGANTNWVSSSSPQTAVVPALKTDAYDAVVFDGVSGLNVLKAAENPQYKLAQWISGGNFYLVSTKHSSSDAFATGETIQGFVKTGNAAQSFLKLSKDIWKWSYNVDTDVIWATGVADVKATILANDTAYDYYILAEPVLTATSKALKDKNVTLNVIYDLQAEWKKAYQQATIPAAALFINTNHYATNKGAIDLFLKETQARQDKAAANDASVKTALDAYGDDTATNTRFGFTSALASTLQKTNRFSILASGVITDKKAFANGFATTLGGSAYADNLFLD